MGEKLGAQTNTTGNSLEAWSRTVNPVDPERKQRIQWRMDGLADDGSEFPPVGPSAVEGIEVSADPSANSIRAAHSAALARRDRHEATYGPARVAHHSELRTSH